MNSNWNIAKRAAILFTAVVISAWGASLVYFFTDGSIDALRAGIKLIVVFGILSFLYDRWQLLNPKSDETTQSISK